MTTIFVIATRDQVLYAVLCGAKRALNNVGNTIKSPHGVESGYDPSHRTHGAECDCLMLTEDDTLRYDRFEGHPNSRQWQLHVSCPDIDASNYKEFVHVPIISDSGTVSVHIFDAAAQDTLV